MNKLSDEAKKLSELANKNLNQLAGQASIEEEEVQDYYLGILRRQAILLFDLSLILKNRNKEYITTPYIILRSVLDDFLHILYLELHQDKKEQITLINAKSHNQIFKSLKQLTISNHKYFDGKYPSYLNNSEYEELKKEFSDKAKNKKYFDDVDRFKFKTFIPLSQVASSIDNSIDVNTFKDRAYYLWADFSTFVHYSNASFHMEMNYDPVSYDKIEQAFQFCYNSIYLAFKHFERTLKLKFIHNDELHEKHGIIYDC